MRASDAVVVDVEPADGAGYGIAFDGANMWVGVNFPDEIIKVRASDDVLLGTFPVVNQPVAALFDGVSIYFSSFNDSTVTRLQLSDGAVLATLPTGDDPEALAFDGKSVWVAMGTMTGSRGSSPRTARRGSRWATPRSSCSMTARACGSRTRSRIR